MSLMRKTALRRTHPMARDRPIARAGRKPLKAKRRPKAEAERIYGPKAFRDWLHRQQCMICLLWGYTEQAHAKGDGVGRKAYWRLSFPACGVHPHKDAPGLSEGCHGRIHRVGVKTFEKATGIPLLELAAETHKRWQAYTNRNSA